MLRFLYSSLALATLFSTARAQHAAFPVNPWIPSGDSTPIRPLDPPRFVEITAGAAHACALSDDGQVWCWGANNLGQAGVGSIGGVLRAPTRISSERGYVAV